MFFFVCVFFFFFFRKDFLIRCFVPCEILWLRRREASQPTSSRSAPWPFQPPFLFFLSVSNEEGGCFIAKKTHTLWDLLCYLDVFGCFLGSWLGDFYQFFCWFFRWFWGTLGDLGISCV